MCRRNPDGGIRLSGRQRRRPSGSRRPRPLDFGRDRFERAEHLRTSAGRLSQDRKLDRLDRQINATQILNAVNKINSEKETLLMFHLQNGR